MSPFIFSRRPLQTISSVCGPPLIVASRPWSAVRMYKHRKKPLTKIMRKKPRPSRMMNSRGLSPRTMMTRLKIDARPRMTAVMSLVPGRRGGKRKRLLMTINKTMNKQWSRTNSVTQYSTILCTLEQLPMSILCDTDVTVWIFRLIGGCHATLLTIVTMF